MAVECIREAAIYRQITAVGCGRPRNDCISVALAIKETVHKRSSNIAQPGYERSGNIFIYLFIALTIQAHN
jgi:hypothetical protein